MLKAAERRGARLYGAHFSMPGVSSPDIVATTSLAGHSGWPHAAYAKLSRALYRHGSAIFSLPIFLRCQVDAQAYFTGNHPGSAIPPAVPTAWRFRARRHLGAKVVTPSTPAFSVAAAPTPDITHCFYDINSLHFISFSQGHIETSQVSLIFSPSTPVDFDMREHIIPRTAPRLRQQQLGPPIRLYTSFHLAPARSSTPATRLSAGLAKDDRCAREDAITGPFHAPAEQLRTIIPDVFSIMIRLIHSRCTSAA